MMAIVGRKAAEKVFDAGLLGICAALLLSVLLLLNRGIDLTDEGAYLNSIATPALYPSSLSLYGFFYHPLLIISDYNVVLLRAFNYGALVILTFLLVKRTTYAAGIAQLSDGVARVGLWGAFTASALFFYCIWLPTPNYNSLNVSGALLLAYAVVGMAMSKRFSVRDIVIAAVALSLCALAKPSTGAALAVLLLVSTIGARRAYVSSIVGVGLLSAILCCAVFLAVRGSPSAAIQSFRESEVIASALLTGQSTFQIYLGSSFPYVAEVRYALLVCAIAIIAFFATEFRFRLGPWAVLLQFAAFSALLVLCVWMRFRVDPWNRPLHWTPTLFAVAAVLCQTVRTKRIHAGYLRVTLILLAIPFATGIGSNTGMSHSAAQAAAVWAVASLFILATAFEGDNLFLYARQVGIAAVIAVVVVVAYATYFPQRQVAPLWAQHTWIAAHGREEALRVDVGTAAYFRNLASAAQANGFSHETDVIDLTGNAAVTIYVLGGNALGSSYFSGGNPWSEWLVKNLLNPVPRSRLEQAWVITREKQSDTIDPSVLHQVGLDFPNAYRPVGHAVPPSAAGEQTLWKPKSADRSMHASKLD